MLDEVAGGLDHAGNEDHVLGERHAPERAIFVGMARIGKFDRQRAHRGLMERRQDFFQRDVVNVRPFPIAVTDMQPHPLARDARDRLVDHRHVQLARLDEIGIRPVAVEHGAVHGEIGRVDLQEQAGLVNRPIFVAHLARQRREIGLVRIIIGVEHGRSDDAGRRRGHESLGERLALAGDALEARDLPLDRRGIVIVQLGLRLRRILLPAHIGEPAREILHQLGKFLEFAPAPAFGFAAEAGHALRHVSLEADALLLAIVADVDAGLLLLSYDVAHRRLHLRFELPFVKAFARLTAYQQLAQRFVARQAADMGGEDAVAACNHGVKPGKGSARLS